MRFAIILLSLLAAQASAFEFAGFKSGSSEEEVQAKLEAMGASNYSIQTSSIMPSSLKSIDFKPSVRTFFDHNDHLYKMELQYSKNDFENQFGDNADLQMFADAFVTKYGDAEISSNNRKITVTLEDKKLAEAFYNHKVNEMAEKL
ncbi:hypothetical protein [Alteromonas halophila]|uniref:Uncharacterized protein n=1 Tax=Alteromonas halophila TaxID=516698 RepID=A0A918JQ80_9ALTE|nr:hypothetical protein [Alteromonas halophila]GGW96773.1 hypothetical protein GCM10007391_33550 [Alteromonas halophila]